MRTKSFIFATSLLLSAVSTCGLTSCQDDEADDFNHQPEIHRNITKNKNIKTTIKATDDALKLCDIKISYTYNGQTTVEVLDESKFTETGTDSINFMNEIDHYDYRQCTIGKNFGGESLDIVVTAVPKTNALTTVENMQDAQTMDFVITSKTTGYNTIYETNNSKQLFLEIKKTGLESLMERSVIKIEKLSCK